MKKILFVAAILAAVSFASCSKTCKCTVKDGADGFTYPESVTEKYTEDQCKQTNDILSAAGVGECSMQ